MNFKQWLWSSHKDIIIVLFIVFSLSTLGLVTGHSGEALIGYIIFTIIGVISAFEIKKHWKGLEKDENGNLKD